MLRHHPTHQRHTQQNSLEASFTEERTGEINSHT